MVDPEFKSLTYLSPTGMVGGGFTEEHFINALDRDLAFIGCDAGSCDGGPSYLGANEHFGSRAAVKRDLAILLRAARKLDIPLLIGSCGGSGGNWNVDWMFDILKEIAAEEALKPFKTALIYSEPDRDLLVEKFHDGKLAPLNAAPPVSETALRDAVRVVGMMGAEGFQAALGAGADVVLAGRATDASIFAAIPLLRGFDPGLVWHAAKIMECGGAAVTKLDRPEGMLCTLHQDRFVLEPVSPVQKCSPTSIASHALYETGDPFEMREPSGILTLQNAVYEAVDDRSVVVSGSGFRKAPYSIRLEGAEIAGYRAVVIGGIRDPILLARFDAFMASAQTDIDHGVVASFGEDIAGDYQLTYRAYGRDGVLGQREPLRDQVGHEIGLFISVVAKTQETANAIASLAAHRILHHSVPEWTGLVSNLAFPIAPHVIPTGAAYRFMLNHAVFLDDPLELFDLQYRMVNA